MRKRGKTGEGPLTCHEDEIGVQRGAEGNKKFTWWDSGRWDVISAYTPVQLSG